MKSFAKFLTGVTFVIVLLLAYYIYTANLPTILNVSVEKAAERSEEFLKIQEDVKNGNYENVSHLDSIDSYYFVTMNLSAKNFSPFAAEWAQFVLKPMEEDVLVLLTNAGPKDIGRFKEASFTITILTSSPEPDRCGWLEYYILGRFHSVDAAIKKAE